MQGRVVWFEVMGQDPDKLQAFYRGLFGWHLEPEAGWPDYGMLDAPEDGSGIGGGIGKAPAGPGWTTFYVQVEDVGAAVAQAVALGAALRLPPTGLPDGSTIALVDDPEGHVLGLVTKPSP